MIPAVSCARTIDVTYFEPWRAKDGALRPGKSGTAVSYESFTELAEELATALDARRVSTADAGDAVERAVRTAEAKARANGRPFNEGSVRAAAAIDAVKGGLLAFAPATFSGDTRSKATVERVTCLALDVDHATQAQWDAACEALNVVGLAWFAYGSPKDGLALGEVRRRLLVATSRDVTPAECAKLRERVPGMLGLECDPSTVGDASRLFYVGAVDDVKPYADGDASGDGLALDVDATLAAPDPRAKSDAPARTASRYAGVSTALAVSRVCPAGTSPEAWAQTIAKTAPPAVMGEGGHTTLFGVACDLVVGLGLPPDTARGILWREYNPRCDPPWRDDERSEFDRKIDETSKATREAGYLLATSAPASSTTDPFHPPAEPLVLDTTRQGTPRPTIENVCRFLANAFGSRIRYDEMRGRILCVAIDDSLGHFPAGLWTDAHTVELTRACERIDLFVSVTAVRHALIAHARRHSFNLLRDDLVRYAERWDGVPRVDLAMSAYWGADDTPAARATSRVFLLSLAARGLEPGCKVDTCPILVGPQGAFKSTSLEVLAGGPDKFGDSPLEIGNKEALQVIRGKWIWEFGELASTAKRDSEAVKAFLSAPSDTFRASYGHFSEDVPRTTVFAGSTNKPDILRDATGARRFMPIVVGRIDIDALRRDREALLGEAACRVGWGEQHWPTDAEKIALAHVAEEHHDHDTWEESIRAWLRRRRVLRDGVLAFASVDAADAWLAEGDEGPPFTLDDLFHWAPPGRDAAGEVIVNSTGAIPIEIGRRTRSEANRAADVLRRLGYERRRAWAHGGGGDYVWYSTVVST